MHKNVTYARTIMLIIFSLVHYIYPECPELILRYAAAAMGRNGSANSPTYSEIQSDVGAEPLASTVSIVYISLSV